MLNEKSVSKSQQRFFGMVHQCKKTADEISDKDAEDFAKTKHKGLPEKKDENAFSEWLNEKHPEYYNENDNN